MRALHSRRAAGRSSQSHPSGKIKNFIPHARNWRNNLSCRHGNWVTSHSQSRVPFCTQWIAVSNYSGWPGVLTLAFQKIIVAPRTGVRVSHKVTTEQWVNRKSSWLLFPRLENACNLRQSHPKSPKPDWIVATLLIFIINIRKVYIWCFYRLWNVALGYLFINSSKPKSLLY